MMYEIICGNCNQVEDIDNKVPKLYIAETSRTIQKKEVKNSGLHTGEERRLN